jgi:Cyclic nucleotide-binding domain
VARDATDGLGELARIAPPGGVAIPVFAQTFVRGLTILALAHVRRFVRLDKATPTPGPELELLRRLAMFAPLLLAVIELLAAGLEPREFPAGAVVVHEGEAGELFYLIVAGSAAVSVRGKARPPLTPGDCFGEIALLRGIPRTATVVADQPLHTLTLDREAFLVGVTGNTMSSTAADTLVTQRLNADSRPRAVGPEVTAWRCESMWGWNCAGAMAV